MIFRQLFEPVSGTYSYVLASRSGGEALIIDPVLEKVDCYLRLMEELELNLVKAVDSSTPWPRSCACSMTAASTCHAATGMAICAGRERQSHRWRQS
jgi:hypothetical protein